MNTVSDDTLYLVNVLECIGKIDLYIHGLRKQRFLHSPLIQDAVLQYLRLLAQSADRLTEEIRNDQSNSEWDCIGRLRDIVAYNQPKIDWDDIWNFIHDDLPPLRLTIPAMIE
jgi:uncharacterized protein with HEPN domain